MIRPSSLRTAARPFVTRALRGGRGRRLAAFGLLLTALSGLLGTWLAVGTGEFERELREELRVEPRRYHQEHARYVLIADGEAEAAALRRQLALQLEEGVGEGGDTDAAYRVREALLRGALRLREAALTEAPRERALQFAAMLTWETWSDVHDPRVIEEQGGRPYFAWDDPEEVAALAAVVERGGVPAIEVYASPLGPLDALRLAGALAGGFLVLLLLLAAPVLAGTQMAQETHENTLQPLAGSALRADELALGLTSGPLAVIALLAAPQLALLLAAALAVGEPAAALLFLAATLAGAAFLVMLAQLAGLAMGKIRSPGLVGGGLAATLGLVGGIGLMLATQLSPGTAGTLALLPQAAASHALFATFGMVDELVGFGAPYDSTPPVVLGALGMLCFAGLGLRALARRIGQTSPSTLRAGEALLAAVVAMVLVSCANPYYGSGSPEQFYLLNLGVLTVPLAILLMMRAPTGEAPFALGRAPIGRLMLEFFGGAGLYLAATGGIVGPAQMHLLGQPVALAYLLWFLAVAGLLSLRVTLAPLTFASRAWVSVCAMALPVAFWHAMVWARIGDEFHGYYGRAPLLAFGELSPFLGAVQAILTLVIPWTLWRALRGRAA